MLLELFQNLVGAIAGFFLWLWRLIASFFQWLWHIIWNHIVDAFWDIYATVVSWVARTVSALFPSDSLDFQEHVDVIIDNIAGFDQILPIHESFALLSFVLAYHLLKILVRHGSFCISMVRKLLPF